MTPTVLTREEVLARSYEACRQVTRTHARSFSFASHVLPKERRMAAYALYAFCRSADDAVDTVSDVPVVERFGQVQRRLDRVFAGEGIVELTDLALADVVQRYGHDRAPFDGLLEGMRIDLEPVAFDTTEQLLEYCHLAAGVVGEMLLPVLGASGPEARARADDLGIAMQLTNILRDVGEDLDRERIYLPAQELALFGLTHEDVRARRRNEAWRAFLQFQIQRARDTYARADLGVPLIRTWGGRLCTRVMRLVYGDILRAIELNRYDVFSTRARTTTGRKVALLTLAFAGVVPPSARALPSPRSLALPRARQVLS
jgi:phytoene synthase